MLNIQTSLRALAKTTKWQSLFSLSKTYGGFQLFDNVTDFNGLQLLFLNYLSFYHMSLMDIEVGDMPEWAFKKDIYLEAYSYYRQKNKGKQSTTSSKPNDFIKSGKGKSPNKIQGLKVIYGGH